MITQVRSYYVLGHNSKSNHQILKIPTGNERGSHFTLSTHIKKYFTSFLGTLNKEKSKITM